MSNIIESKEKAEQKLLRLELSKLAENVSNQNKNNAIPKVALRGFVGGVFSALGATIGFAVLIFFLAKVYSGADNIPLVDSILQRTQLNKIIDYQLEQIQQDASTENPSGTKVIEIVVTPTPQEVVEPTIQVDINE